MANDNGDNKELKYNRPLLYGWVDLGLPAVLNDALSEQQLLYRLFSSLAYVNDKMKELYEFVNNFVLNIDVEGDVNKWMEQAIQDGTIASLINMDILNNKVQKKHTLNSLFFQKSDVTDDQITPADITEEMYQNWLKEYDSLHYVPGGNFTQIAELGNVTSGKIGNGVIYNAGTVATYPNNIIEDLNNQSIIVNHMEYSGSRVKPQIAVSTVIHDDEGANSLLTRGAGIYSYVEQNGKNTRQAPKAIMGVSVNGAGGDNDSTGVVGYSYKRNIPEDAENGVSAGVGDCAGAGGACWQYSEQTGLAIGGEFSCHQQVPGTTANNGATNHNKSTAMHISTNSLGSPCANGIIFDSGGLVADHYGFWNAMCFAGSTWAHDGEGPGIEGTTLLNFSSATTNFPDIAFKMGNAREHFSRESGNIRVKCDGFDLFRRGYTNVGLRMIGTTPFIGFYNGTVDADGTSQTTPKASITCTQTGSISIRSYNTDSEHPDISAGVVISKLKNAFYPTDNGTWDLGINNYVWRNVYAINGTIQTSDKRKKTKINNIDDDVLDAWEKVEEKRFKFKSAVKEKGDKKARTHFGYIAQDIIQCFKCCGLDAFDYGIVCTMTNEKKDAVYIDNKVIDKPAVLSDEGDVIEEEKFHYEKQLIEEAKEAEEVYAIRYDEVEILNVAVIKRKLNRIEKLLTKVSDDDILKV